jgi:hypothetical protein
MSVVANKKKFKEIHGFTKTVRNTSFPSKVLRHFWRKIELPWTLLFQISLLSSRVM